MKLAVVFGIRAEDFIRRGRVGMLCDKGSADKFAIIGMFLDWCCWDNRTRART